jgi:hypothetical protein
MRWLPPSLTTSRPSSRSATSRGPSSRPAAEPGPPTIKDSVPVEP